MKQKTFIFIFSILFLGCAPFSKKIEFKDYSVLKENNLSKLNGVYEVKTFKAIRKFNNSKPKISDNDSINRFSLFEIIKSTNKDIRNDVDNNTSDYTVRININNSEVMSFTLLKNEKAIDSAKVKYIIKDGFVYLKNKNFKTLGVPGLAGNFEVDRTKIGLNNDGNLIVYNSYYIYGAILFIIGDTRKQSFGSQYKKKT